MVTLSHIEFLGAIDRAVEHNPRFLAEFLRSGPDLTIEQRHKLADFIEGKLKRKPHRPKKKLGNTGIMQLAAWQVKALKREWRKAGRRSRIHEPAITEVVQQMDGWGLTSDKLINFMRRSKRPRKSR